MHRDQFVVRHGDKWAVRSENSTRIANIFDTQAEAISLAKERAIKEQSEMRVQGRNGKFRMCNSYGNDPCPPRDKNL